ncbi:MAG: winged helix-turn-helix transcriptional regulator [Planctomycetes bacterium]|nr:winged helix-turn-helix transcriptional regulator [Planctomycetota bacterium]
MNETAPKPSDLTAAGQECEHEHGPREPSAWSPRAFARAVRLFKALGDPARLRLLETLSRGAACVSELAEDGEPLSTVSHRLRLLRNEGLVSGRRDGKHVIYALADDHVAELVRAALEHGSEP